MGFSRFFLLSTLLSLPVLVALWVGILGLRHSGRGGAWWSMAAGVTCSTVGLMISIGGMFLLSGPGSSLILFCISTIPSLGFLLFAIGFAMHGLKAARSASRVQELEQLAAAMSEEIHQLRGAGSKGL